MSWLDFERKHIHPAFVSGFQWGGDFQKEAESRAEAFLDTYEADFRLPEQPQSSVLRALRRFIPRKGANQGSKGI